MRFSNYLLLSAAAIAPAPALADDGEYIVVTATRAETPLSEIGQSITVIPQEDIETRQAVAVIDLLRNVPGVTFTRNGGIGSTTNINIRGAESDHTVALIDGVKLNDPSAPGGGFSFADLLTGNIARIEVVRGSQSVLWGSQAIGGVVNMITREPTEELAVNAHAEYGYRDTVQAVGNVSGKFGPVAAALGAGYFRTDGISTLNEDLGGTEKDGYRNFSANGKVVVTLTDAISVDLRGWYSDARNEFDAVFIPADSSEYGKTKEFVGYSGVNLALFDGRLRNRFAFAYTKVKRDNFDPDGFLFQTFDAKGENERFEYQGILDLSEGIDATFGAETETSRFATSSYGGPVSRARARIDSVYGQLSVTPITGFTATGGVRYDDHDTFGGETTFAANAVYSPNEGATTLRASYGEGFKAPSLFQLMSEYGNDSLQPETSKSWDVGITQRLIGGAIEVGATWFHRDTDNLIDFVSCPVQTGICENRPFGTYDNVRRAHAEGVEFSMVLKPVEALDVSANYTWLDTENRDTGLDLARRPRQSVNASIDYRWPFGLQTGATITHVGDSFDNASNTRRLESYVLVDIRASLPVTERIELYGRIENLFDERYETIFRYGQPGRAAYAGVRLSY
jgi:vitamin B12 transporter